MEEEKEEIIELTEVVEEPPNKEVPRLVKETEEAKPFNQVRQMEEIAGSLKEQIEQWLAKEGVEVLNQGIREIVPPIFGEELSRQLEKLKMEVEKIRALKEGLSMKIREWLDGEGSQLLKKETREILPKIGEELLGKEINQLQEEVEKIRGLRETLNAKAEQWFQTEGILVLKERATEVVNQIWQEKISPELEKLHWERQRIKDEDEIRQMKMEAWLKREGAEILENKARELFPEIAIAILQKEIAQLKKEVEEQK